MVGHVEEYESEKQGVELENTQQIYGLDQLVKAQDQRIGRGK